ncbi:type II toxin-antitoxin system Phd/YefM family antitoxin [Arthrobacter castelli]|uniref:type II toxin-antitoxin system Phd/YefM family antitoxin n=1 Tax=Arthrobacter castelli TaxID=271431 RepID=UPI0003F87338|nr:type II toxin-antitoxin system prevent-host-death family antitoxin [Arthrobacter castelli]
MSTIPHRELRNESSRILQRVKNGETIEVTNNGEIAATLVPPNASPFEMRVRAGRVRVAAPAGTVDLVHLERARSDESTAEILADLRGDR